MMGTGGILPLWAAIRKGHLAVVRQLLAVGASNTHLATVALLRAVIVSMLRARLDTLSSS